MILQKLLTYLVIANICVSGAQGKQSKEYFWHETAEWSSCSKTCDIGTQQKKIICIEKSSFLEDIANDEKCNNTISKINLTRECNLGDCQSNYYWRPSKWSECSQTCGNNGQKSREVECVYAENSGDIVTTDFKNCIISMKPETFSSCNMLDCPLTYELGEWGRCVIGRSCTIGTQRRNMTCVSILKNGQSKVMPRHACSGTKPPISWRKCFDFINTKECMKTIQESPIIEMKSNTLFQMRKTKVLTLNVGQLAYVLLYTRIIIQCPVKYFVPRDLIWKHGSKKYKYQGKSKNYIKVDKEGQLRIRKFRLNDQGTWTCFAGPVNASAVVKVRNPSVGFQDWMLRTLLWNKEMLNEDPQSGMVRHELVQWIQKGWSSCSVTCGAKGVQSRNVHCEKLDTRHYIVLPDEVCEKQGQKKPISHRSCQMGSQCPKWSILDMDQTKCTNKCLKVGFGQIQATIQCLHQEKEMDFSVCSEKEKPYLECPNDQCQVAWKISSWSKCSVSCGGQGIMARYLICIWKNTEEPAGSLCYSQNLELPQVIKTCTAPKCNLKCVDLSTSCRYRKRFCQLSIYRYTCCKTCSRTDFLSEMQGDESRNNKVMRKKPKDKKNKVKIRKTKANGKKKGTKKYIISETKKPKLTSSKDFNKHKFSENGNNLINQKLKLKETNMKNVELFTKLRNAIMEDKLVTNSKLNTNTAPSITTSKNKA